MRRGGARRARGARLDTLAAGGAAVTPISLRGAGMTSRQHGSPRFCWTRKGRPCRRLDAAPGRRGRRGRTGSGDRGPVSKWITLAAVLTVSDMDCARIFENLGPGAWEVIALAGRRRRGGAARCKCSSQRVSSAVAGLPRSRQNKTESLRSGVSRRQWPMGVRRKCSAGGIVIGDWRRDCAF